jgi:hypothetical protein
MPNLLNLLLKEKNQPSMNKCILTVLLFSRLGVLLFSQELPIGYISYFSNACTHKSFFNSWHSEDADSWKIIPYKKGSALRVVPADSLKNPWVPETRGILSDMVFGDFILEFEFRTTSKLGSGFSGFYFLGPVKTSQNYYTIAFTSDTLVFFYIDDSVTYRLSGKPVTFNKDSWNKVRITRDILTRQLQIVVNNNASEKIVFTDRNLVMGYIGFGTHRVISNLKNINLWAPTSITDTTFAW